METGMLLDRREFLRLAVGGVTAGTLLSPLVAQTPAPAAIRAVAFDAFPIFDPRPFLGLAETLFPGKGAELSGLWRTRQFEYQWLRSVTGHYADFLKTTEDGLVFAARTLQLELTSEKRALMMGAYRSLEVWPDVPPAVRALKKAGIRLALLSNMTTEMLVAGYTKAGLDGAFEHVLSTDRVKAYKPDPRAYRMAVDAFELDREEILFAAFAGWDAAGAKWFGYPTFWVNRLGAPAEELGISPDATGRDLNELLRFLKVR